MIVGQYVGQILIQTVGNTMENSKLKIMGEQSETASIIRGCFFLCKRPPNDGQLSH